MTIHIEKLTCSVIIGILEHERVTPQRIIIDLQADYSYATNSDFIDYAKMSESICRHLKESQYGLLEDALEGLSTMIRLQFPLTEYLFIKLSKPDILSNCNVALSASWNFNTDNM